MTGLNSANHGVTQWTFKAGDKPSSDLVHPTLSYANWNWNGLQAEKGLNNSVSTAVMPQILKQAGYRTMFFGKGHFGARDTPGADPKVFGFDIRIGGRDAGGPGSYWGIKNYASGGDTSRIWRAWDLDHFHGQDLHLTEALTIEAKRAIKKSVDDKKPFFCYFAHYAVHTPIEPDKRFAPDYLKNGLDETEAAYASLVEGMDKSVGDLMNYLKRLNVLDNTIIVFTSDNGGLSHSKRSMETPHTHNAPLSSGKGSHHEGGIRVPLIVKWQKISKAGTANDTPIAIYDWFPTLLSAAGIENIPVNDGLNLITLIQNHNAVWPKRSLVWHFPNFWGPLKTPLVKGPGMGPCSVIMENEWKLIYYHTDSSFELFNLESDIGEKNNRASGYKAKVKELSSKLGKYLRKKNAVMPVYQSSGKFVPWPDEI